MKTILLLLLIPLCFSFAQYVPQSAYLQTPENLFGYVDSCAKFWKKAYDASYGGFYTNIDQFGNLKSSWGTNKNMLNQSRDAYGFTKAFQLTGDTSYLRYAKYALSFMTRTAWDTVYHGWYNSINRYGSPTNSNNAKTAYYQHYALLGLVAYYEAVRDTSTWRWITKGYDYNNTRLWDSSSASFGYYDNVQRNGTSPSGKSFNATVDAVTTHLLHLYLMTGDSKYKTRLLQVADNMVNRLAASASSQAIGFVEKYNSAWQPDNNETMTIMGHVLKTAWCLARIFEIEQDSLYLTTAEQLADMVLLQGYDHDFGGPYKDYNRITGAMLMWGQTDTAKAWWQMEQAITSGLVLYHITGKDKYLQMADETIRFFMQYFVDHTYGEVFSDRTRYGNQIWGLEKGNDGKAAYHSIETGYYSYVYGKLFFKHEPITLYYNIEPANNERTFTMKPIELPDGGLSITNVTLNGNWYANYDEANLTVTFPPGTSGIVEITYEAIPPTSKSLAVNLSAGWNLISLPLQTNETEKSVLYPTATSSAFFYEGISSYQPNDTIRHGIGYWLKFDAVQNIVYHGQEVLTDTISVEVGWNLIGSITLPVAASEITSIPGGIVTAQFFGYKNGYYNADSIQPAQGYWVKVSQAGQLVLSSVLSSQSAVNRINIIPTNEFPPSPPEPQITNLQPETFVLEQNYPNPFNPVTVIGYRLQMKTDVSVKVFNTLGEEVAVLVDEIQNAGYQSVTWDASSFPSGIYFYKITVNNFSDVKRLVLLK